MFSNVPRRKNKNEKLIKEFGDHLRSLRKAQGLSQEKLANSSDLWLSIVGRIERGEIDPTLSTLNMLAYGLGISLNNLFGFQKDQKKAK